jgi:malate dehydrogenase
MQCATNTGFIKVSGVTNDYSKTANSNVVVITSGIPRETRNRRELVVLMLELLRQLSKMY